MTAKQTKEAEADEAIARLRAEVEVESSFNRGENYLLQAQNASEIEEIILGADWGLSDDDAVVRSVVVLRDDYVVFQFTPDDEEPSDA